VVGVLRGPATSRARGLEQLDVSPPGRALAAPVRGRFHLAEPILESCIPALLGAYFAACRKGAERTCLFEGSRA
jgi:hypothetical protein